MPACLFHDFIYGDPFYIRICYQTVYRLALASMICMWPIHQEPRVGQLGLNFEINSPHSHPPKYCCPP